MIDRRAPGQGRIRAAGRQGRVLWPAAPAATDAAGAAGAAGGAELAARRAWLPTAMLPMFAQLVHYLIDVGPFYYLSKIWPFLSLPLALRGMIGLRSALHPPYLLTLAYALGVTPVLSMLWLGNRIEDAAVTTVKVWPLTYYFAVLALLAWRQPAAAAIRTGLVGLGVATYGVMVMLWLLVPASWYAVDPAISKLFIDEMERGRHIFMPMTFGFILLFYLLQRMTEGFRPWQPLAMIAMFAATILISKERIPVAAALAVCGWILVTRLPRLWRSIAILAGAALVVAGLVLAVAQADRLTQMLGGSLSIRLRSVGLAWAFLTAEPLRWLFGVGGTTRFGSVSLIQLLGSREFYLADIGWLGVLFEYGVVGLLLLASLYVLALRLPVQATGLAPPDAAMVRALKNYVLYLLLTTAIYSPVFTPGELATVSALMFYLTGRWHRAGAA